MSPTAIRGAEGVRHNSLLHGVHLRRAGTGALLPTQDDTACWAQELREQGLREKLLEAADQLAQFGESEEEEIYQTARGLELRMQAFIQQVEQRKTLLSTHTPKRCRRNSGGSVQLCVVSTQSPQAIKCPESRSRVEKQADCISLLYFSDYKRWDQVIALQVTSKSQVFALKSESSPESRQSKSESSPKSRLESLKSSPAF
ncbi:uncharacterized protein [Nerophis lumbriciformis]|uniref:uncharacterized protein n=1 Tax=Nerophis lumbriciformis TaxID=546530 RepID=UPI002ADF0BDD|nr:uncharacterized protein LOC133617606 [Nerophis lumbriciformis]